ncbi:CBO0543 family protein [Metabacillus sp. YM-086]|uniref:CBO0543 family protein n=1 Tax=Metabacillus sp. YM-086 TaxID=3341729 RepID=UPI001B9FDC60
MLTSFLLDQIGASLQLWTYPVTTTQLPRDVFDPADLSILPMFYMVIYQYFPKWKSYILGQIFFAFFAAYIGGNIYQWLGIYKILKWKHIHSVPIYILMGIAVKWILNKLKEIETSRN